MLCLILYGYLAYNIAGMFFDISDRRKIKHEQDPLYHYYP